MNPVIRRLGLRLLRLRQPGYGPERSALDRLVEFAGERSCIKQAHTGGALLARDFDLPHHFFYRVLAAAPAEGDSGVHGAVGLKSFTVIPSRCRKVSVLVE